MRPLILSIDEGTTNAKAVCLDQNGQILSRGSTALSVTLPQAAWTEQDPMEILAAVSSSIKSALEGVEGEVHGIGISNQRESVLAWDRKTGQPLSSVVVWQCRRSQDFCEQLANSPAAEMVQYKTGLPIDPLFPAAKIRWLLENMVDGFSRAEKGEICVGTIDSWLVWNLSGGRAFVTDESNASRTQLLNIHNAKWDPELCEVFGVPMACLAEVMHSCGQRATTLGFDGLADGVPILSQIGDSHAALYGQGGFVPGMIKATYGTGSSLMTSVDKISSSDYRLAKTIAWNDGKRSYALEGNITHTGAAATYMSKLLGLKDVAALVELAQDVSDNNGVYFVPALSGLGAPHWQSSARGIITGLTDSASPSHLARASLESIVYQVADVFFLMQEMAGRPLEKLFVDGGPTQNDWLMQIQAQAIKSIVVRGRVAEVSALGAGYLAGKALGWWPDHSALAKLNREVDEILPEPTDTRWAKDYEGWKSAIKQTLA